MSNENKILNLIKLGPSFIILVSIVTVYMIINSNNTSFDRFVEKVEEELINEKKLHIKREVERVYNYIESENKQTRAKIKKELKHRVHEAHTIAKSIYENNLGKSKEEITKLISDALRNIRFNEGRGYFFIYELDGINIMHPVLRKLEGKSLWNFKDKKGFYIARESKKTVMKDKEGFLTWWWTKPNDAKNEYEKIGFVKIFKPLNWYIGTGEYIYDYEQSLKKELQRQISKIRFGNNGYIFLIDKDGTMISHINPKNIGRGINDKEENWVKITKQNMKVAKNGNGYTLYINKNPTTNKYTEKVSYVNSYKPWEWTIGSGIYINDLKEELSKKRIELAKNNKNQLNQLIMISIILFTFFILISIYFVKILKNKFINYKTAVKEKALQLETLNNNLEYKVLERTNELEIMNEELKKTIKDLGQTKEDLLLSQKMATLGELVSSITHEINTPLGISITSISHIEEITKKTKKNYLNEEMTEDDFNSFLEDLSELSRIISINLNNTAKLVKGFKNVAVDQAIEEKREFKVKSYLEEILLALKSKIKKYDININIVCDENIILNTYPNYIFQIFTNLINNSLIHGFGKTKRGNIEIIFQDKKDYIEVIYKDDGKGIEKNLVNSIFKEYFTTKKGKGGTGLGLFIIKEIVEEKLNGEIILSETNKAGVEFIIKLKK